MPTALADTANEYVPPCPAHWLQFGGADDAYLGSITVSTDASGFGSTRHVYAVVALPGTATVKWSPAFASMAVVACPYILSSEVPSVASDTPDGIGPGLLDMSVALATTDGARAGVALAICNPLAAGRASTEALPFDAGTFAYGGEYETQPMARARRSPSETATISLLRDRGQPRWSSSRTSLHAPAA